MAPEEALAWNRMPDKILENVHEILFPLLTLLGSERNSIVCRDKLDSFLSLAILIWCNAPTADTYESYHIHDCVAMSPLGCVTPFALTNESAQVKELQKYSVFSDAGLFVEEILNKTSAPLLSELVTDISTKKRQRIMQMHLTTTYEAVNELDFCLLCMGSAILKDSTLSALPLIQNCFFSEENK
ncbi:hypothetical protein NC652_005963 [Populus alba x Populus x berolinensis]|nr:hypothetical protein NC652_005963 [Populus alba x Populus x berolinensis]